MRASHASIFPAINRWAILSRPSGTKTRRGISLIEVLISMFVLLIGLMGVAAMFPVGSYYMVKAEQLDRATALAQSAANEMVTRGLLSPQSWVTANGQPALPLLSTQNPPPWAVVIDPLGVAEGIDQGQLDKIAAFPRDENITARHVAGGIRPIRVTFPGLSGQVPVMPTEVADLVFRSRDDLSFDFPERRDAPANLLFDDVLGTQQPLRRQTLGEYSWLITIAPRYDGAGNLVTGHTGLEHQVSVVVFHRRNLVFPTGAETEPNEREVGVEFLFPGGPDGGEVRLVAEDPRELNGMRQGEWIMLFGMQPLDVPGNQQRWFMGWYRIVAMDLGFDDAPAGVAANSRIVSLKGPRWPWPPGETARAGLFAGAIGVYTKTMRLESPSAWSIAN